MAITRMFLGWDSPALRSVVNALINRYSSGRSLDLSRVQVVLPGRRAGRRILELLVEQTSDSLPAFVPPQTFTFSSFPEQLYEPQKSFASPLVQKLTWARALRSLDETLLRALVPELPDDHDFDAWSALGDLLRRQHRELAADGIDFGDVIEHGMNVPGFDEEDRWRAMRAAQEAYLRMLDDAGLWDRQTARLVAIDRQECATDCDIILVGTVDIPETTRRMLRQVADRVTALIIAPEELADLFDEFGALRADAWQYQEIPVTDSQVRIVNQYGEQADAVVDRLVEFDGHYRADEITIGAPDESFIPRIRRQLQRAGVRGRPAVDKTVATTAPFRLLQSIADYLETRDRSRPDFAFQQTDQFASLIRHPDFDFWLDSESRGERLNRAESQLSLGLGGSGSTEERLAEFDQYLQSHLQPQFSEWLGKGEATHAARRAFESAEHLLTPLMAMPSERTLPEWADAIVGVLESVYQLRNFDPDNHEDRLTIRGFHSLDEQLQLLGEIPDQLSETVSITRAIRMVLAEVRNNEIPPLPDDDAVELLGWLELPLDDAPALIVTGINDGIVPKATNSDPFLPDSLRRQLGLDDNSRRYARDAYALSVVLASRESVTLVMARASEDNDPLTPSRLWFATNRDQIAQRVLRFYDHSEQEPRDLPTEEESSRSTNEGVFEPEPSLFFVPRPPELSPPINEISITSFRTYLECRYRYYLRHVLRLREVTNQTRELDAPAFGSLLHKVVEDFGRSEVKDAHDPDAIAAYLHERLNEVARWRFGKKRRAAVTLQLAQMRSRLEAFANWQAIRAKDGWRIWHTEQDDQSNTVPFPLTDGRVVTLKGRVDRIDRRGDEWIIFDYKTGDRHKTPQAQHRKTNEWVDLQLPLYLKLAEPLGVTGDVKLGYISLPADLSHVGDSIADWDEADLHGAFDVADQVAQAILGGEFWPPEENYKGFADAFSRICQDSVLERELQP